MQKEAALILMTFIVTIFTTNAQEIDIDVTSLIPEYQTTGFDALNFKTGSTKYGGIALNKATNDLFGNVNSMSLFTYLDRDLTFYTGNGDIIFFPNTGSTGNVGIGTRDPISKFHIYSNDSNTSFETGLTIEQDGIGDAQVQYLLKNTQRWVTGIDNSDGDKFIIGRGADWSQGKNLTITASGNVGIGTTNPGNYKMVIKQSTTASGYGMRITNADNSQHMQLWSGGTGVVLDAEGGANLHLRTNNIDRLFIQNDGNVGIGTKSPLNKLHIVAGSEDKLLTALTVENDDATDGHTAVGISFIASGGNQKRGLIAFKRTAGNGRGDFIFALNNASASTNATLDDEVMRITKEGNVGIGTKTTGMGSHKLAVEGSIGARSVKIEAFPNWSDFVFEESYELPTLVEVEEHIKENGHLKDIPSAKEVKDDGIDLGQMDAKLLQKIEELTLYMIDMNKQVQNLKTENQDLKEKMKSLENE